MVRDRTPQNKNCQSFSAPLWKHQNFPVHGAVTVLRQKTAHHTEAKKPEPWVPPPAPHNVPVGLALGRWRQKDQESKVILGYIASSRSAWVT